MEYLEDRDCGKMQSQSLYTVVIVYIFISEVRNAWFCPVCLVVFLRWARPGLFIYSDAHSMWEMVSQTHF